MSTQKTVSLPKGHVQLVKDTGQGVTAIARKCLNEFIENENKTAPKTGSRDRGGEKHRTTVRLSKHHIDFINNNNVDLSRTIRENIQEQIDRQRALQQQENGPDNITPEGSRALIAIISKSQNSTLGAERIQSEWIHWYFTGEMPFWE